MGFTPQVTGATGGVGKRVVDVLLKKGVRVRALARNKSKALAILNQGQEPKEGTHVRHPPRTST
eukprot:55805-Eustigmatos_ZCMA.PRE.1